LGNAALEAVQGYTFVRLPAIYEDAGDTSTASPA
jgi:hypothetical protein